MMIDLAAAADKFRQRKNAEESDAGQRVALRLLCGIDLDEMLGGSSDEMAKAIASLKRMIVRERNKGLSGHWSYDLNRHIALKQACNRLEAVVG